jgi:hypothetical protein
MSATPLQQRVVWETWIGKQVYKESGKSGAKLGTVTGIIEHPITENPAFTMLEDGTYVECRRCMLETGKTFMGAGA